MDAGAEREVEAAELEDVTWWRWWLSGYQLDIPAFPFTSALCTGACAAFPMKHMLSHTHYGVWFQFTANEMEWSRVTLTARALVH